MPSSEANAPTGNSSPGWPAAQPQTPREGVTAVSTPASEEAIPRVIASLRGDEPVERAEVAKGSWKLIAFHVHLLQCRDDEDNPLPAEEKFNTALPRVSYLISRPGPPLRCARWGLRFCLDVRLHQRGNEIVHRRVKPDPCSLQAGRKVIVFVSVLITGVCSALRVSARHC